MGRHNGRMQLLQGVTFLEKFEKRMMELGVPLMYFENGELKYREPDDIIRNIRCMTDWKD